MKTTKLSTPLSALAMLACFLSLNPQPSAAVLGTSFTYHGRLNDGGIPAQGIYDLRFAIYDAADDGSIVAGPITNSPMAVTNGLFVVRLDFGGGVFTGDARWLEIGVRTNSSGADFTVLSPRQNLTPTPYALYAPSAGIALTAATATNVATGGVSAPQLNTPTGPSTHRQPVLSAAWAVNSSP